MARIKRGGAFNSGPNGTSIGGIDTETATFEMADSGFRLVMIPEPSTSLLVIAGLLGLANRRARP